MSAMAQMMADILAKAIPKELLDAMTPEKIEEYKLQASTFVNNLNDKLDNIEAAQEKILLLLEGKSDDGNNNNSK